MPIYNLLDSTGILLSITTLFLLQYYLQSRPKMEDQVLARPCQEDDILRAECEYWWPLLSILWNPPSKLHWNKSIIIFADHYHYGLLNPIPRCALISAARHGQAVLGNRPQLAAVVMENFLSPLQSQRIESLLLRKDSWATKQRKWKHDSPAWWKPRDYAQVMASVWKKPEFSRPENAKAMIRSKHLTRELRNEERRAVRQLQIIHEWFEEEEELRNIRIIHRKTRVHIRDLAGITLSTASSKDSESENCFLCTNPFFFPEDVCMAILNASRSVPKQKGDGLLSVPDEPREEWAVKLVRQYHHELTRETESEEKNTDKTDEAPTPDAGIVAEVRQFGIDILNAYFHQRKIKRTSHNFALKLVCGHVFCDSCMHTWVEANPAATCPLDRRKLDEVQTPAEPQPLRRRRRTVGGIRLPGSSLQDA
jgi:hypothetical protein